MCVFATRWFVLWCTRLRYCNSIILCNHYQLHSFHLIVRLHPVLSHLHCQEIVSLLFQCKTHVITGRYTNTHGLSDFLSFLIEEKTKKKNSEQQLEQPLPRSLFQSPSALKWISVRTEKASIFCHTLLFLRATARKANVPLRAWPVEPFVSESDTTLTLNGYLIGPPLQRGPDLATECSGLSYS